MAKNRQQITARGIAQLSGLETFSSIINYTGEYVNWGNALAYGTQLNNNDKYAIQDSTSDPQVDALTEAPPTGSWLRYHTDAGSNYAAAVSPTSGSGYFTFSATPSGGLLSYAGIYQKMSTVTGVEYKIDISRGWNVSAGILYVNTYFAAYNKSLGKTSYKINTSTSIGFLDPDETDSILTSEFTAQSPNDVIVIYFIPTIGSSSIGITNISVKEKQEYLTPVYANDIWGNAHKVLRIAADQILSDD